MEQPQMIGRRGFLRAAGTATVVVCGGVVWRAHDQGLFARERAAAFDPWRDWAQGASDGTMALITAASLAASPHNTQPWLFRVKADTIDLFADPERHLGAFDPYRREMLLGLGCALENLVIAAGTRSLAAHATLLPQAGDASPVARVRLSGSTAPVSPLAAAIAARHTNRGRYRIDRPVDADTRSALHALADEPDTRLVLFDADSPRGTQFARATIHATERIIADHEMYADSERWFHHAWSDVKRKRDGLNLFGVGLSPLMRTLALLGPPPSPQTSASAWLTMTRESQLSSAPVFGALLVRDLYDARQTLLAGRLWQRAHLEATLRGVAMQPLNQTMEWADRDRELGRAIELAEPLAAIAGEAGWHPTFGFRAGIAVEPGRPSVRRDVRDIVAA
jgi:hypothetical protein